MYKILAISAMCAGNLLCQSAVNPKDAVTPKQMIIQTGDVAEFGPIGITAAMAGPAATIAGAPYSAQAVTERVQILGDGNRIEQSTSGSVARDRQGRVRRDEGLPGLNTSSGDAPHLVSIDDPVAGLHWTLDASTKTAIKIPLTKMKQIPLAGFVPPPPGEQKTWFVSTAPAPGEPNVQIFTKTQTSDANVNKTDLGTRTVEGVAAQGTRITRTLPAGAVGNQLPIVITTETWYSQDLKVLVMSKTDDPRMGETTYKLTDIQRSEPPANLFQVPDDYIVKDQPTNNFVYQSTKKNP